jgi:ATP-dependent helicase/nuclease subunit A
MAEKLTPEQKMAVENRGGRLLVSAAAGSGKTKVLVDRLMGYLLDPVKPANIDDFLMITYTKAAAAELRGKIAAKLAEKVAADPGNRHLQRQQQRLYLAKISTVHAFCGDILREYAYRLDLSADFRVADEQQCDRIRETVMEKVLKDAYDHAADSPDFCAYLDTQGVGRNDRLVPELVMQVYDSARCHLDPQKWLEHCLLQTEVEGISDASQSPYGAFLMERLRKWLDLQIVALNRCASQCDGEGMQKVYSLLKDTAYQLGALRDCSTWDEIMHKKQVDFGRLVFPKSMDDEVLKEQIKTIHHRLKALETQ